MSERRASFDALEDERAFLLESLRDLERERAAGDVSEDDYRALHADYTRRAAGALRAIEERAAAVPQRVAPRSSWRAYLGRRGTRRVLAVSGTACLAIGVALAAASFAGVRLPGQSETGSVNIPETTRVAEQLVEASELANADEIPSAISLYGVVLSEVPHQAEALTYRGWLERLSGLRAHSARTVATGDASMLEAVRADPRYPDARALYGIALAQDDHDRAGALGQFTALVTDHPSSSLLEATGAQIAAIYASAHETEPAALRARNGSSGS